MTKYKAKKLECDGIKFDSKKERNRYIELKLLERAGEIKYLQTQVKYPIVIADIPIKIRSKRYKNGRQLTYIADFTYVDSAGLVIEDTKGFRTDAYKIKKALMEAMGYEIRET